MWARLWTWSKAHPKIAIISAGALLLALAFAVYGYRWYHRPAAPASAPITSLPSTPTPSGASAYIPNQIPSAKPPKVVKRTVTRPVSGTPVVSLPPVELAFVPATLPPSAVVDNVVRPTELIATAVVPPHRGDTDVRTYLDPAGDARTYLYPQREAFLGFDPLALELSAGAGVGGSKIDIRADYRPLRLGDFHVGAEVRGWQEPDGTLKGAGSVRVYYEPFRR